ncbi:hypothetical protein [Nannocystis radixulma]|nr:hypothetical protein [Nannocystis radixulma]
MRPRPVMQQWFAESKAPDDITWLISLIEAVSPNFDRASLDGPSR